MTDLIEKALTAKRESKYVEFKEMFNPRSPQDWCEITKDIVAIANSGGGIILFGVDNAGIPSGVSIDDISALDPADVANKISKYTGSVDLEFEIRELKKNKRKLISFLIYPVSIPIVFRKPGTYEIGGGKQKTAFGVGTVYFRHGAKSEPGNSDDIRRVLERQIEVIRRSWIKGVRKVVQAPQGSQIVTVRPSGAARSPLPLVTTFHAVKDPDAIPVLLTRDMGKASGTFVHEEVSEGIFDEINNVLDANKLLAKGKKKFVLGPEVYYRIYAEREHVESSCEQVELLAQTGFRFYAPVMYWLLKLPRSQTARIIRKVCSNPKSPTIYNVLRLAVLLGSEVSMWVEDRLDEKWAEDRQPPPYYWAFKKMISSTLEDRRLVALRTEGDRYIGFPDEGRRLLFRDLLENQEKALSMLRKYCVRVFEGRNEAKSICRYLDVLVYGKEFEAQGQEIASALIENN